MNGIRRGLLRAVGEDVQRQDFRVATSNEHGNGFRPSPCSELPTPLSGFGAVRSDFAIQPIFERRSQCRTQGWPVAS